MKTVMPMKTQCNSKTSKKLRLLLFCILAFWILSSALVTSCNNYRERDALDPPAQSVAIVADDYHSNHNFVVPVLSHHYVSWSLQSSNGVYGDFEVTVPSSGADQIITFFICDQANYDLWDSGETASVYHLQENVGSYSFHFRIPYTDTWYFVFKNYAVLTSKTINFDLYRDLTPPAIDMNLDAGATYSGIKEITATITEAQFSINTVRLYIDGYTVDTEYDSSFSYSWDSRTYSNGAHTVRISASDNVGNSGYEEITVLVSNAGPIVTSPTTTGGGGSGAGLEIMSPIMLISVLGIVGLVVVLGVLIRARGGSPRAPPDVGVPGTAQGVQEPISHAREKEVVSERFLVICPFCGSKNEQGTINCHSCGAKL